MKRLCFFLFIGFLSCSTKPENSIKGQAAGYFEMYSERSDWQAFQDLFADDLVFEDVIFRYQFNKEEFVSFYNWPDSAFKKHPDFPQTLVLINLTVNDSSAVGSGYFTPFYYGGQILSDDHHWRFTIELTFNKDGKIKYQKDFIEYAPEFMKSAAEALIEASH